MEDDYAHLYKECIYDFLYLVKNQSGRRFHKIIFETIFRNRDILFENESIFSDIKDYDKYRKLKLNMDSFQRKDDELFAIVYYDEVKKILGYNTSLKNKARMMLLFVYYKMKKMKRQKGQYNYPEILYTKYQYLEKELHISRRTIPIIIENLKDLGLVVTYRMNKEISNNNGKIIERLNYLIIVDNNINADKEIMDGIEYIQNHYSGFKN